MQAMLVGVAHCSTKSVPKQFMKVFSNKLTRYRVVTNGTSNFPYSSILSQLFFHGYPKQQKFLMHAALQIYTVIVRAKMMISQAKFTCFP